MAQVRTINIKVNTSADTGRLEELTAEFKRVKQEIKEVEAARKKKTITDKDANKQTVKLTLEQKKVGKEIQQTQRHILNQDTAVKAAKGSYDALVAANAVLNKRLRALPNAFDKTNKAANALKKEIFDNTQRLKDFDKEINRDFRNVGNYAEGIIKAEKALRAEKATLEANTRALKTASKNTRQGSKEQDLIQKELKETERKYKDVNNKLKDYNSEQGQSFQLLASGAKSFTALAVGIAGAALAFSKIAGIVKDFDQAQGDLRAVLDGTTEEMAELSEQAILLGGASAFTATEVAGLQKELAKLGFTTDQILNTTAAVLDLAAAADTDLANAARITGEQVRAFGLDTIEAERVVNVMAAAFSRSSLDIDKFSIAMRQVAPVAKTFGFSIEDTTALLGTLSDAGFDASQAGTATRNILLNLADANGALAEKLGGSVRSFDELIPALIKLRRSGIDLSETLELTDKRSVAAFNRFLEGAESADKLRDAITGTNEAQRQANERLNTVEGSLVTLNSAFERFVLSVEQGDGVIAQSFKGLVDLSTQLLQNITDLSDVGFAGAVAEQFIRSNDEAQAFLQTTKDITRQAIDGTAPIADAITELRALRDRQSELAVQALQNGDDIAEAINIRFSESITLQIKKLQELEFSQEQARIEAEKLAFSINKSAQAGGMNAEILDKQGNEITDLVKRQQALLKIEQEVNATTEEQLTAKNLRIQAITNEINRLKSLGVENAKQKKELEPITFEDFIAITDEDVKNFKKTVADALKLEEEVEAIIGAEVIFDEEEIDEASERILSGVVRDFKATQEGELAILQANFDAKLITEREFLEQRAELNAKFDALALSAQEKNIAENVANIQAYQQLSNSLFATISDFRIAQENRELAASEGNEAKQEIIRRKFAELRKQQAIVQAAINGALAVSLTIAQLGGVAAITPPGAAVIAATIAATAAQIAVIESQQFAKGGLLQGASHAEGGIPIAVGGSRVVEAEGGEAIINKRSTEMFSPLLSAINQAGGGVAFGDGGRLPAIAQQGTIVPNFAPPTSTQQIIQQGGNSDLIQGLRGVIAEEVQAIQVVNVATSTAAIANTVQNTEADATFG